MRSISSQDALSLSIPERIILVQEIWDTITEEISPGEDLTIEEKKIIDRRLEAYKGNPDRVSEWNEVYKRIVGQDEL